MNSQTTVLKDPIWYNPSGGVTVFSTKEGRAVLSPGLLVINDSATGQEAYRLTLTPDLKLLRLFGSITIRHLGGQKISTLNTKTSFWFHNPRFNFLIFPIYFSGNRAAKDFAKACKEAAASET